ncbi:hypothetical protein ACFVQB_06885 [Paenibacillus sp. NPDC057886]|uniref:hypothetical protein n=1 Tax=Paenibacillus sp. NPDC057886 TaxID=3346270 RepID=UPI003698F6E8
MIKNEERYVEQIFTYKDKERLESFITRSACYFYVAVSSLIICVLSMVTMLATIFISETLATIAFVTTITTIFAAIIFMLMIDRDVFSSKGLNQKLLFYCILMSEYIQKGKSPSKIRMIKRGLIRYLHTLEGNVKNVFIFNSFDFDIQLIKDIRKFLIEDMNIMIKNGKKDEVVQIINMVKNAYYSAESMQLTGDVESMHATQLEDLRVAIKSNMGVILIDNEDNVLSKFYKKIQNWLTNSTVKIIIFVILGLILMYYVNNTEYSALLVNNISVVALIFAFIFYIKR